MTGLARSCADASRTTRSASSALPASTSSSMCLPMRTCRTAPCPRSWRACCTAFPWGSRIEGRRVTVTMALYIGGRERRRRGDGGGLGRLVVLGGDADGPPDGAEQPDPKIHDRRDQEADLPEEEDEKERDGEGREPPRVPLDGRPGRLREREEPDGRDHQQREQHRERDEDREPPPLQRREPRVVLEREHEGDDHPRLRRDRQPHEVVPLLPDVGVRVEPGEADGPAQHRQARDEHAEEAHLVEPELVDEERRRGPERDHVAERVELDAEGGGAAGDAGDHPVAEVEQPGDDDEPRGEVEVALAGVDEGEEPAEEVAEGERARYGAGGDAPADDAAALP